MARNQGVKAGSKLRHLHGPNLMDLEDQIESLQYKTDIVAVNKVGGNWYVHFYVPELAFTKPSTKVEVANPTKVIKNKTKGK